MSATRFSSLFYRLTRYLVVILLPIFVLSACATGTRSLDVQQQVFQDWPAAASNRTYEVVGADKYNLEEQTYLKTLKNEIGYIGLRPAMPGQKVGFQVKLNFDVEQKQEIVQDNPYPDPFFYPGFAWGPWGPSYYGAFAFRDRIRTISYNRYRVRLDIIQKSPSRPVYQSTVLADSSNLELPQVMPYLIKALFAGFPGRNGKVTTYKVDLDTASP